MCHNPAYSTVRVIQCSRVDSVTKEHVAENLVGVIAVMKRYKIRELQYILSMDHTGQSFSGMFERSLHKGFGRRV